MTMKERLNVARRIQHRLTRAAQQTINERERASLERERQLDLRELEVCRALFEEASAALEDERMGKLLRLYYFEGWNWTSVARYLNYDRSTVWRLHRRAMAQLDARRTEEG